MRRAHAPSAICNAICLIKRTAELVCRDFRCAQKDFCISTDLLCDGVNHCGDNTDETTTSLCAGRTTQNSLERNHHHLFIYCHHRSRVAWQNIRSQHSRLCGGGRQCGGCGAVRDYGQHRRMLLPTKEKRHDKPPNANR